MASFKPSVFHTRLVLSRVMGICWSLSQLSLGKRQGLDQNHQLTWHACLLCCGRKRSTRRKPVQTRGEHGNSTQKDPFRGSNQEPSCYEATVLTTQPPSVFSISNVYIIVFKRLPLILNMQVNFDLMNWISCFAPCVCGVVGSMHSSLHRTVVSGWVSCPRGEPVFVWGRG